MKFLKVLVLFVTYVEGFITTVSTGSIGIKYMASTLQPYIYEPGIVIYTPFYTSIYEINIRPQVDELFNVKCPTMDGLHIEFPIIKIWNQLHKQHVINVIDLYDMNYDKYIIEEPIRQYVSEMCNEMLLSDIYIKEFSGLNERIQDYLIKYQEKLNSNLIITKVVLSKPRIPIDIQNNYEKITNEKTKILAEVETQKRLLKEEETKRVISEHEKLKEKSLAELENLKIIANAEAEAKKSQIEYESDSKKRKTAADTNAYEVRSQAEANIKLFTPEYIQIHFQENVLKNTDATYFGPDLPKSYIMSPFNK